jgi:RHS repeat-associated protein
VSTTGVVTAIVNVLRNGLRVAHWAGGSTMVYYHRDRLGSVVATTMNGGGFGVQYRYLPYGAIDKNVVTNANGASELKFTGAKDLYGGLLHLRSRVYSPTIRRFLQADDADSLRYSYAGGDPINRVDPSGHLSSAFSDSTQGRGSATSQHWGAYYAARSRGVRDPIGREGGVSGGFQWGQESILTEGKDGGAASGGPESPPPDGPPPADPKSYPAYGPPYVAPELQDMVESLRESRPEVDQFLISAGNLEIKVGTPPFGDIGYTETDPETGALIITIDPAIANGAMGIQNVIPGLTPQGDGLIYTGMAFGAFDMSVVYHELWHAMNPGWPEMSAMNAEADFVLGFQVGFQLPYRLAP